MRYSYEQLGTGNVSQERIQEVVLQTLFKMAEQEVSQADILRMVNQLLINLEKLILFKKLERFEEEDIEKFNQQITENKEIFIARELNKIKKAVRLHESIMRLITAAISLHKKESRYIHRLYLALKRLQVQLENDTLDQLESNQINKQTSSKVVSSPKAEELAIMSTHYQKLIADHKALIVSSRKFYIQKAIEQARVLQATISLFKGMLMPAQQNFIDEYFTLKEYEAIETTKLDQKIQGEINKKAVLSQRANEQGMFMTRYYMEPIRPALTKWLADKKQIKELTLQKVKILGERNKNRYINTQVADDVCSEKLAEFENHPAIKDPLAKHLELVKQQTILIEQKEKVLTVKEQELAFLQQDLNRKSESYLYLDKEALNQSLQELGISALEIDSSQLKEITLVNNLHAKCRPRR